MFHRIFVNQGILLLVAGLVACDSGGAGAKDRYGDSLPKGVERRIGTMRTGGWGAVYAALFLPGDESLVLWKRSGDVVIWDWPTGKALVTEPWPDYAGTALSLSPDGMMLVAGGNLTIESIEGGPPTRVVRLWKINRKSLADSWQLTKIHELEEDLDGPGWIDTVAFSPDGKAFAVSGGNRIRIRDTKTGKVIRDIESLSVHGVAWLPDGRHVASAQGNGSCRIWSVENGEKINTLGDYNQNVMAVAFSPDGAQMALAVRDSSVRLWDAKKEIEMGILRGHEDCVRFVTFSPNGAVLASSSQDWSPRLWDVKTGKCIRVLRGHTRRVFMVAFSSDGRRLLSCSEDGTALLWNLVGIEPRPY